MISRDARDAVLLVLPYGMCFRNIVMNEDLWGYLTQTYHVDILTDFEINKHAALGIRHIFSLSRKGVPARLARAVNHAGVHCLRLLEGTQFFLWGDLGSTWAGIYRVLKQDSKRGRLLLFGAIKEYQRRWPASWIVKALNWFPFLHPASSVLMQHRYAFVMLGHTNENECILVGRQANRHGVPVICPVMGVDNLTHGLLLFVPDLLLLWGRQQVKEFVEFHLPLKPELARTRCEIVGSLIYDNYVKTSDEGGERLRAEYGIAANEEIMLFPAYPTHLLSGQQRLCELIVEFLIRERIRAKFLIRLRPDSDPAEWTPLADRYPDTIRLQVPVSAAYAKDDQSGRFDVQEASEDIALFVRTVRNSTLLVLPSLSTMYLDALVFGVPSVIAMFNYESPGSLIPHRDLKTYLDFTMIDPAFRNLKVAASRDEMLEFLRRVFILRERDHLLPEGIFELQVASSNDGQSGARASRAIQGFLESRARPQRIAIEARG